MKRFAKFADYLPALILLALLNATQPALASGLMPVCTRQGISWIDPATGEPANPAQGQNACAHGWCKPRREKGPDQKPADGCKL